MLQKTILALLLLVATLNASAQSTERTLIANAGGELVGENIVLNFSIGEPVISFLEPKDISIKLSQGFQQGDGVIVSTVFFQNLEAKVYPNPTMDAVRIEFKDVKKQLPLDLSVFDQSGKLLLKKMNIFEQESISINLKSYPSGTYFIQLENQQQEKGMFKVLKQN